MIETLIPAAVPYTPRGSVRLTGRALLQVAGSMCNLDDGWGNGDKSIIYTPVTTTVYVRERPRFDRWVDVLRGDGSTHILLNVPDGDPSYGNVWQQPDLWHDLTTYRRVLETLLDAGLAPMIWLDHGGSDPLPRIRERWPRFADAMRGLEPYIVGIIACEPVVGDWTSYEVSEALKLLKRLMPTMAIGYHGSPERLVGSSNPVQSDDPWQGAEAEFYTTHGGEHIDIAFYQTAHGRSLYESCGHHTVDDFDNGRCTCAMNRWADYVRRIGGGYHGWRVLPLCGLETVTYEFIRWQTTSAQARDVATRMTQVADLFGVTVGCGNGPPW